MRCASCPTVTHLHGEGDAIRGVLSDGIPGFIHHELSVAVIGGDEEHHVVLLAALCHLATKYQRFLNFLFSVRRFPRQTKNIALSKRPREKFIEPVKTAPVLRTCPIALSVAVQAMTAASYLPVWPTMSGGAKLHIVNAYVPESMALQSASATPCALISGCRS